MEVRSRVMAPRLKSKAWVKNTLVRSGALRFAGRLAAPSAVLLMYHSIVENPELTHNTVGISQSLENFEAHIRSVATRFAPVTLDEVAEFAQGGRPLPPWAVAVTFDDGFADNYECALPVLRRYGVPATFYIMVNAVQTGVLPWYCRLNSAFRTTAKPEWKDPERARTYRLENASEIQAGLNRACQIGAAKVGQAQEVYVGQVERTLDVKPPASGLMMSWDKVRALKQEGHIIGGHTLSHPNLAHVSREEAWTEIVGCKQRLEEVTGEPIRHFSYPHPALNPQWSPQTLQLTREAGFKSAVLTTRGAVRRGDEPLALKRIYAANDLDQWIWNVECTFLGRSI